MLLGLPQIGPGFGIFGVEFGSMGEGYMRFVFANSDENLKEALQRIDAYVKKNY